MSIKVISKVGISIKTFFSSDLRHFVKLNQTNIDHLLGNVEIFNGELMAIAGNNTREVEIMRNGQWNNITAVGNITGKLRWFSSLIIPGNTSDILFVFGNHIFNLFI